MIILQNNFLLNLFTFLNFTLRGPLVSPVSVIQTLVLIPFLAKNHHKGLQFSQPLLVLSRLGVYKKPYFQNGGLTEYKITQFKLLAQTSENLIQYIDWIYTDIYRI